MTVIIGMIILLALFINIIVNMAMVLELHDISNDLMEIRGVIDD